jgi:hypothetical protein
MQAETGYAQPCSVAGAITPPLLPSFGQSLGTDAKVAGVAGGLPKRVSVALLPGGTFKIMLRCDPGAPGDLYQQITGRF